MKRTEKNHKEAKNHAHTFIKTRTYNEGERKKKRKQKQNKKQAYIERRKTEKK